MKENFPNNINIIEKEKGTREVLNLAVKELENIINALPNNQDKIRAEHTLISIKGALNNLGKDGAPSDKYPVSVESYPGNPQQPYVQDEGVPVDELIEILKNEANEINKKIQDKKTLEDLKRKVKNLDEEYKTANEQIDKAIKYSKWEKAKKEYELAEELANLGYSEESKKISSLADKLFLLSKSYFETHYTKEHGEGGPWTKEEQDKQDLRTRHEAKFISLDYRGTGDTEEDYKKAMDVLNRRRELDLSEKTVTERPKPPQPPEPPQPDPLPPEPPVVKPTETKPEIPVTPEPPVKPIEKAEKKKLMAVEAENLVNFLARERGIKLLNEKLNQSRWLKRKWTQMWEPAYRQMLIEEERKKIHGKENKPSWIRRKMFGAKEIVATGEKNLFAGTGNEAESQKELASLVTRFSEDYIRDAEGEQKQQLEDPELKSEINNLIHLFATNGMSDAEFEKNKNALMEKVAEKYPDIIAQDGLTADNFLEAAKDFRKIFEHNKGLARTDVQLEIDLGLAKQAIKTKANLTWVDKAVSLNQKHFGPLLSPEAIGIGMSIGSYFARKPLYWLGGAAGLGGLMGAMRKNVEQKNDLEMHRVERAMGDEISDFGPDAKRRQNTEKFVGNMEKASDIVLNINNLTSAFNAKPDKNTADALKKALAEAEARQTLSTTRERDLISFSGETALEKGRLDFMRSLAEAKVLLKNGGYPEDVVTTPEYDEFIKTFGDEMDKIDSSERWHRWGQNAKAGAMGAVGGLVVGGLFQEGLASLGDHVPSLHWLRPGGKLTSMERLYYHLKGELPTGPTGAGMEQIIGINGNDGIIKFDGSTELTYDKTTGFWNVLDESGDKSILAKFNLDPTTGEVVPIEGSYDPALISFNNTSSTVKIEGTTKTITEWINSMKGGWGKNVIQDKWHLGGVGFLENDTQLPKTEFNELKLFTSYDTNHNLKIDASKLQEYLIDPSGKQVDGSSHAGKILEIAKSFDKGEIKIGLVPDTSHPTEVLQLAFDPNTKTFTTEDGSSITKFFTPDPKTGQPILKGNSLLGMIHEVGARPDGSKNVEWINAIRGNGEPIDTGTNPIDKTQIITEINRKIPKEWSGLWVWNFGRKPLEKKNEQNGTKTQEKKQPGEAIPFEGKKWISPKIEYFEEPEIPGKKLEGKKIKKVAVDTRGQKIETDRKDYVEGYPEKFPLKNEKEMATYLLSHGEGILMPADYIEEFKKLDIKERVSFLEKQIKKERENLKIGGITITKEEINVFIDAVFKHVDKVLEKYVEKDQRSQLPNKEKIHVVGLLEYQAQAESSGKNTLGVCFSTSGEIFINFEALKAGIPDINEFVAQLKRTIAHEIMHDAATNNYWMFQMEEGDEVAIPRRTGIKFIRKQAKEGNVINADNNVIIERGRALNEAITESLSEEITNDIYTSEGGKLPKFSAEPYSEEREIVKMLQKKFDIKFEDFAKAVVNRRALRGLAEKLDGFVAKNKDGKAEHLRPKFMSLLMSIMDYEHNKNKLNYTITKKLITGEKRITISKEMKKKFPSSLLDNKGDIKIPIAIKYFLIDEEAEKRRHDMPVASEKAKK